MLGFSLIARGFSPRQGNSLRRSCHTDGIPWYCEILYPPSGYARKRSRYVRRLVEGSDLTAPRGFEIPKESSPGARLRLCPPAVAVSSNGYVDTSCPSVRFAVCSLIAAFQWAFSGSSFASPLESPGPYPGLTVEPR